VAPACVCCVVVAVEVVVCEAKDVLQLSEGRAMHPCVACCWSLCVACDWCWSVEIGRGGP
jgi:hypothetical protein